MYILKGLFTVFAATLILSCNTVQKADAETGTKTELSNKSGTIPDKGSLSGIIVRDCTGTYIQSEGKDYRICNFKKIQDRKPGSKISVTYEKPESCPEFNGIAVCMMYHEHSGLIRILTVK